MADMATSSWNVQSNLPDLSGLSLDAVSKFDGLSAALTDLRAQLAHTEAPLCQGENVPHPLCPGRTGLRADPALAVDRR